MVDKNNSEPDLEFKYDATGNRIVKTVKNYGLFNAEYVKEYYIRDAQGNVMAVYKKNLTSNYSYPICPEEHCIGEGSNACMIFSLEERPIYGSSRIANIQENREYIRQYMHSTSGQFWSNQGVENFGPYTYGSISRGKKIFELSNHLGNVLTTITDQRSGVENTPGEIEYYTAHITSAQDYYPFGSLMPGRSYNANGYRFGFNGKEKDDEAHGVTGSIYNYEARMYDSRLGRFLTIDPLSRKYSGQSPFSAFNNNPIIFIDPNGEGGILTVEKNGKATMSMTVVLYTDVENITDEQMKVLGAEIKSYIEKIHTKGIRTNNGQHNESVEISFNIDIKVKTYSEAKADASTNKDVSVNYFYVGEFIEKDEEGKAIGSTEGGFQKGNSGIISKNAPIEKKVHELLYTLGFYTEPGGVHQHPNSDNNPNDGSVLNSPTSKNGTLTEQDLTNLFFSFVIDHLQSNIPSAYYKVQKKPYGDKNDIIYNSESAKKVMSGK